MTEDSATPFSDFLDDYFAECDEHLMGVRRLLLALEVSVGRADINRSVLDELFRHFHSLKGISGMVELRPAEDLAHHLEDYLRALRQGEAILTADGVDALFDGAQMLEQVLGARRAGNASPPIDSVVSRIARLVATVASAAERASAAASARGGRVAPAQAPSVPRWRCTFSPSAELVARGIRVDTVRKRLSSAGEILSAVPRVTADGAIAFEFELAARLDDATLASLAGRRHRRRTGRRARTSSATGRRRHSVPEPYCPSTAAHRPRAWRRRTLSAWISRASTT